MIDFRYHLVSLISVFLALAVGIALGAGPLKESIGDTLTGQVDQLRAEKEQLRAELDGTSADLAESQAALDSVAADLLDGLLGARRVAVVALDEVPAEVLEEVTARLTEAGATVSADVTVTAAWTDPDRLSFRRSLAATLVGYLDPVPATDAGTGTELAEALMQGLTTADPANPDLLAQDAAVLLDLLGGDAGLVTFGAPVTAPADAVVLIAGPADSLTATADEAPTPDSTDDELAAAEARIDAGVQLAVAAQERSGGAVVAGGEPADPGLVATLRSTESTATQITTVQGVHGLTGQVAVPMALAARIGGTIGHYGPGDEATSPMPPRVVLPPVERVPAGETDGAESTEPTAEASAGTQG